MGRKPSTTKYHFIRTGQVVTPRPQDMGHAIYRTRLSPVDGDKWAPLFERFVFGSNRWSTSSYRSIDNRLEAARSVFVYLEIHKDITADGLILCMEGVPNLSRFVSTANWKDLVFNNG